MSRDVEFTVIIRLTLVDKDFQSCVDATGTEIAFTQRG